MSYSIDIEECEIKSVRFNVAELDVDFVGWNYILPKNNDVVVLVNQFMEQVTCFTERIKPYEKYNTLIMKLGNWENFWKNEIKTGYSMLLLIFKPDTEFEDIVNTVIEYVKYCLLSREIIYKPEEFDRYVAYLEGPKIFDVDDPNGYIYVWKDEIYNIDEISVIGNLKKMDFKNYEIDGIPFLTFEVDIETIDEYDVPKNDDKIVVLNKFFDSGKYEKLRFKIESWDSLKGIDSTIFTILIFDSEIGNETIVEILIKYVKMELSSIEGDIFDETQKEFYFKYLNEVKEDYVLDYRLEILIDDDRIYNDRLSLSNILFNT